MRGLNPQIPVFIVESTMQTPAGARVLALRWARFSTANNQGRTVERLKALPPATRPQSKQPQLAID